MNNCIPCETPKTPLEAARLMQHHLNSIIADLDTLNRMNKSGLTSVGFEAVRDNVTSNAENNTTALRLAHDTYTDMFWKEAVCYDEIKPFTTNIPA